MLKKSACGLVFQHTSRSLDNLMKHSSSCLIYYVKNSTDRDCTHRKALRQNCLKVRKYMFKNYLYFWARFDCMCTFESCQSVKKVGQLACIKFTCMIKLYSYKSLFKISWIFLLRSNIVLKQLVTSVLVIIVIFNLLLRGSVNIQRQLNNKFNINNIQR